MHSLSVHNTHPCESRKGYGEGLSPLTLACDGGQKDMTEILLSAGAIVDQLNRVSECSLSLYIVLMLEIHNKRYPGRDVHGVTN